MFRNWIVAAATVGAIAMPAAQSLADRTAARLGLPTKVTGPTVAAVSAGQSDGVYLVDVYVKGVSDLRGYQVAMVATGGEGGKLELATVSTDQERQDYVFGVEQAVNADSVRTSRLAAVAMDRGVSATDWAYLGTFGFRASSDAQGEFRVTIQKEGKSLLTNSNNDIVAFEAGPDVRINVGGRKLDRDSVKSDKN